jgi:hypothetical protein
MIIDRSGMQKPGPRSATALYYKTGFMVAEIMQLCLSVIFNVYFGTPTNPVPGPVLVLMDSATPHIRELVTKLAAEQFKFLLAIIPGHCTAHIQPIDYCVGRIFQARMRIKLDSHPLLVQKRGSKVSAANRRRAILQCAEEVVNDMNRGALDRERIRNSFVGTGIISALDPTATPVTVTVKELSVTTAAITGITSPSNPATELSTESKQRSESVVMAPIPPLAQPAPEIHSSLSKSKATTISGNNTHLKGTFLPVSVARLYNCSLSNGLIV